MDNIALAQSGQGWGADRKRGIAYPSKAGGDWVAHATGSLRVTPDSNRGARLISLSPRRSAGEDLHLDDEELIRIHAIGRCLCLGLRGGDRLRLRPGSP